MLEREAEGTPSASLAPRVALGGRGAGTRHCSAPFMQGGGPLAPGGQGRGGSLRLASERGVGSWAKAPAFPEGPGQWQAGHGAHAQECGTLHLCPSVRPVAPETGQLGTTALHRNIERCGTERGGPDPAAAASPVASPAVSRTTHGGVRWQRRLVGRLVLVGRSPVPRAAKACPRRGGPGTPQLQGGRDRPSRATGCPGSCVSQGENDCISVARSGHTAWGESGRWPSPPGDASTPFPPPGRPRRSQRALDGAAGPGAYCFWPRWELSEYEL